MNLTVASNIYSSNKNSKQNTPFTSFSPEIINALEKLTPYEKKVARTKYGVTDKIYRTVEQSPHELSIYTSPLYSNGVSNDRYYEIGNYNTHNKVNDFGAPDADSLFSGIRSGYKYLKGYIEPGTKINNKKKNALLLKKDKLTAEITALKAKKEQLDSNSKLANDIEMELEYKTNDLDILREMQIRYEEVVNDKPKPWNGISKKKYKSKLNNGYKKIDKEYRTEFSKYKTSKWRQSLDDIQYSIKYWIKNNFAN